RPDDTASAHTCSSAPALAWTRRPCQPDTMPSIGCCASTSREAERIHSRLSSWRVLEQDDQPSINEVAVSPTCGPSLWPAKSQSLVSGSFTHVDFQGRRALPPTVVSRRNNIVGSPNLFDIAPREDCHDLIRKPFW